MGERGKSNFPLFSLLPVHGKQIIGQNSSDVILGGWVCSAIPKAVATMGSEMCFETQNPSRRKREIWDLYILIFWMQDIETICSFTLQNPIHLRPQDNENCGCVLFLHNLRNLCCPHCQPGTGRASRELCTSLWCLLRFQRIWSSSADIFSWPDQSSVTYLSWCESRFLPTVPEICTAVHSAAAAEGGLTAVMESIFSPKIHGKLSLPAALCSFSLIFFWSK